MMKNNFLYTLAILFMASGAVCAQDYTGLLKEKLLSTKSSDGMTQQDVEELTIYNQSTNNRSSIEHVYAIQKHNGIEIFNAIVVAAFRGKEIVHIGDNSQKGIAGRIKNTLPVLTPKQAATKASSLLGAGVANFTVLETKSSQEVLLDKGGVSLDNVPVKLMYQLTENNGFRLAWDLSIHIIGEPHWYSVRVDAENGEILSKNDWYSTCTFGPSHSHKANAITTNKTKSSFGFNKEVANTALAGSQYNVFPLPVESPNHGVSQVVLDPYDIDASPFGWHDTDGIEGPEFTITRGNNVSLLAPLPQVPPEGGDDLVFDFEFNLNAEPETMFNAASTNLFYLSNVAHDIMYHYGFDEASGNFQETNYTGLEDFAGDYVVALSQDPSDINNASFATPPEGQGSTPILRMNLWDAPALSRSLRINEGSLEGSYIGIPANFGGSIPEVGGTPLTSNLIVLEDACDTIVDGAELEGNIVVARREGACDFSFKVLAAENAGAIAVIIVNNTPSPPFAMGAGSLGSQVTIPSIMVSQLDGEAIIAALQGGEMIEGDVIEQENFMLDSSLDNLVVMHEYAHGLTSRLVGGPLAPNCVFNVESMSEGWSDYYGLMFTMSEDDLAEDPRGVVTYLTGEPVTGTGVRPFQYSVDFNINDLTYSDTNRNSISVPHGIGTVGATMLWDITWFLIDEYGFDPDLYNGVAGNNISLQLVTDALKLTTCAGGFIDVRDGLLSAIEINTMIPEDDKEAITCSIWGIFAQRGLGLSADQGSPFSRTDQTEAFDSPTFDETQNSCILPEVLSADEFSENNFSVFPNPSNGQIGLSMRTSLGEGQIKIIDLNGRVVFSQENLLEGTLNINASGLSKGVYLLQVSNETVSEAVKLIIK